MHTPRKIVFAEAMSPQRFAQEAVLRAQDAVLATVLPHITGELTEEVAEMIARKIVLIGHAVAEAYDAPRMPD